MNSRQFFIDSQFVRQLRYANNYSHGLVVLILIKSDVKLPETINFREECVMLTKFRMPERVETVFGCELNGM